MARKQSTRNITYRAGHTLVVLGLALISPLCQGASEVNTGLWETTVTSTIPGMPMTPPPVTTRQCLTDNKLVPHEPEMAAECRILDQTLNGNTLSWSIECNTQGMKTVSKGRLVYSGDTFTGNSEINMQGGPMGSMTMTQTLQGRRVGDCP